MHGMLAASVASEQCRRLVGEGLSHLHIYALNRTELPLALVQMLGVARGAAAPTAAAA
jgi:methylenetetrahydrofolate reductase (NADPH)